MNTANAELAGSETNGHGKMSVNVPFIVTTNELVALKEENFRESKIQCCDSSADSVSSVVCGNSIFILPDIYVGISSSTRRCSRDRRHCHTNEVLLPLLM